MFRPRNLLAALALVAVFTPMTQAGFNHAGVLIDAGRSGSWLGDVGGIAYGTNTAGLSGAAYESDAFAEVNPFGDRWLKVSASSTYQGDLQTMEARAIAQYRDIIRVTGDGPRPETIRLHFTVDGGLNVTQVHPWNYYGTADFAVRAWKYEHWAWNGYIGDIYFGVNAHLTTAGEPPFRTEGFDSFDGTANGFIGTFHYDVAYNAALGGYAYNLSASAATYGYGTILWADFDNTVKFTRVTNTDGTALAGTLSFDSGFQFVTPAAVPEPASLALLGVGAAGLVGVRLRRRTASA